MEKKLEKMMEQILNFAQVLETKSNDVIVPNKKWFNLKECCELKGVNYKTVGNKPYLKPNRGKGESIVGGRDVFSRATVIEWLEQSDSELQEIYSSAHA